jgi:Na+/proline symporter
MYWKKTNQWGAVAGYVGGFIAWVIFLLIAMNSGLAGGDPTVVVCEGDMDCAFWDAVYIGSFPAFFVSLGLVILVSLFTQKLDPPKPITDIDGNPMDISFKNIFGVNPLKDALRKMRPEEYDD